MTDVGLSDTDLSRPGILEDCRAALMRCERGEASYLMWAIRWGRPLLERCEAPEDMGYDISNLENENIELEDSNTRLRSWIEDAVSELECADDDELTKSEIREKINAVIQLLEKALA